MKRSIFVAIVATLISILREAKANRHRILDALAEILVRGVEALSVRAVAKQAVAVPEGAVYRHFGDEARPFQALMPHAAQCTATVVEDALSTIEQVDKAADEVRWTIWTLLRGVSS